jgi:two-component system, chemotaxis family, chemotaxis protein CheY
MPNNTLMIIDDSKVSRMMISAMIKSTHPEIDLLEASNAQEALDICQGKPIDYFSVDFNMPGIDGLELIAKLKAIYPNGKFALLTANIQEAIQQKSLQAGAVCINKPISEASIAKMLEYFDA